MAAALSVAALLTWGLTIVWMHQHHDDYWQHPASVIALRSLIALAVGLSVAAALAWPNPERTKAGMRISGDLSYGVYLWHLGILLLMQVAFPELVSWTFGLLVVLVVLVVSCAGWFGLERPVQAWARRRESTHGG